MLSRVCTSNSLLFRRFLLSSVALTFSLAATSAWAQQAPVAGPPVAASRLTLLRLPRSQPLRLLSPPPRPRPCRK
jgi:hypothetical protein